MEYERSLSYSEAKYKYFSLIKKVRNNFPDKDVLFKAKFKRKTYDLKVNNKNAIMLSELYPRHQFSEGDTVKFTKHKDGIFEITAE